MSTTPVPGSTTMALHFLTQELIAQRESGNIIDAINANTEATKLLALATIAAGGDDNVSSRHTRVVALHTVMEMLGLDDSRRP